MAEVWTWTWGDHPGPLSVYSLEGVFLPVPGLHDPRPRNSQPLSLTQTGALLPERMLGAFIHQNYVYVLLPGSGMGTRLPGLEGGVARGTRPGGP